MPGAERHPSRATSALPAALAIAAFAVAAVWINLGTFHRLENGDSVLPVLMSLHRWAPFIWEQNRFGMLLPLLAMPIRHPLANLLFQRTPLPRLGDGQLRAHGALRVRRAHLGARGGSPAPPSSSG